MGGGLGGQGGGVLGGEGGEVGEWVARASPRVALAAQPQAAHAFSLQPALTDVTRGRAGATWRGSGGRMRPSRPVGGVGAATLSRRWGARRPRSPRAPTHGAGDRSARVRRGEAGRGARPRGGAGVCAARGVPPTTPQPPTLRSRSGRARRATALIMAGDRVERRGREEWGRIDGGGGREPLCGGRRCEPPRLAFHEPPATRRPPAAGARANGGGGRGRHRRRRVAGRSPAPREGMWDARLRIARWRRPRRGRRHPQTRVAPRRSV